MICLTAKWLSGDIVSIDVPKGTTVARALPLLTQEKNTVLFLENALAVNHEFHADTMVSIFVKGLPRVAFVFEKSGQDCYVDLYKPYEIKPFVLEDVLLYEKIITDYYVDTQRLKIPFDISKGISYRDLIDYCDRVFRYEPGMFFDEEIRLRWREYRSMVAFHFMLPDDIQEFLFPIDDNTKRHAKLTPSEWFSFFSVKR